MRAKLNLMLHFENETTGEIVRSSRIDIYIDTIDGCSMDYLKACIVSACDNTINIVEDI